MFRNRHFVSGDIRLNKSLNKSEKGRILTCLRKQRQRYNGAQDFVALAGQRFFPLRSSLALCAFKSSKFIV